MKTNGTLTSLIKSFCFILIILLSKTGFAQPDYDFRNSTLESGTALQVGAVYRFPEVKPGVDGLVTVIDMTGGMTLADIDGPSGFAEAFQPYINCAGNSRGYVEFTIDFVIAGTNTPMVQMEVPLTAIDIDGWVFGDGILYECDDFETSAAFYINYDMLGGSLNVYSTPTWVGAINTEAITYNGIDTVQKNIMFTAVHSGVTSVRFRVGADNHSANSMLRLRSVYFKKFIYANALMPLYGLLSFNGVSRQDKTFLNWEFAADCKFSAVVIERSTDGKNYQPIANMSVAHSIAASKHSYTDYFAIDSKVYYRLKITVASNKYNYSNVLLIKGKESSVRGFSIYPNIISSDASISLYSDKKQQASLLISDYSGRIVKQENLNIQVGNNSIQLSQLDRLATGSYIAIIRTGSEVYNQKIIVR